MSNLYLLVTKMIKNSQEKYSLSLENRYALHLSCSVMAFDTYLKPNTKFTQFCAIIISTYNNFHYFYMKFSQFYTLPTG